MFLNFITWNADPILVHLGPLAIRWYGLSWALGIWFTLLITQRIFKHEKLPEIWVDKLFMYTVIGAIVGARLGHCFFLRVEITDRTCYNSRHYVQLRQPLSFASMGTFIYLAWWFSKSWRSNRYFNRHDIVQ